MVNKYSFNGMIFLDQKTYRAELSKMVSMANKRLVRLEKAGLQDSPAYKKWVEDGGAKFSVKGKSHNELQKEFSRLKKFIESETSTIRGVNNVLKNIASNTGIKFKNLRELHKKAEHFFELASKVEQYLRTVEDMASAIGYQKIWEAINQYVKKEKLDLADTNLDIEEISAMVGQVLADVDSKKLFETDDDPDTWLLLT